jgi:hypothetical protein
MACYVDLPSFLAAIPGASGLDAVRSGVGWTELEDRALATGYPIVRFLDPSSDVDVEAAVVGVQKAYPSYGIVWPSRVAARLLRAWGVRRGTPVSTSHEDLTEEEARAFVAKTVVNGAGGAYDQNEDALLLLEAFVGPAIVVDAAVSALEVLDEQGWGYLSHLSYATIVPLGVMLERLPASTVATLRQRMAALYERHAAATDSFATRALRLVLEGATALDEAGHRLADGRLNPRFCITVTAPSALAPIVASDDDLQGRHEARLAYLAGEAGVHAYAMNWTRAKKPAAQARLVETLGVLRHDAVVTMMLSMVAAGKAKGAVHAWCNTHPDVARGEFTKVSGQLATTAATLLKKLPKR